jgi:isopropylmalate/homocitrate/citramalate synthase
LELQVLDTTLRDGSNAIPSGYADQDVEAIVTGLAACGVAWIEIGHGVSMSAADERACEQVRRLSPAQLGAVLVPALTRPAVLDAVMPHLDFVRLAPGPGMLDDCLPSLRALRRGGCKAFLQLVKTHTYPRDTLVERVRPLVDEGLHALYVVDTAGSMVPET